MTALAMPVLIGRHRTGVEVSYWYLTQRSMQNAADSAAIAAATNGTASYGAEAKAAAAKYGFVHGANNISVTARIPHPVLRAAPIATARPVTGYVPLFLSQVVGYQGSATVGGSQQTMLSATAVARLDLMPREYASWRWGPAVSPSGPTALRRRTSRAATPCRMQTRAATATSGRRLRRRRGHEQWLRRVQALERAEACRSICRISIEHSRQSL